MCTVWGALPAHGDTITLKNGRVIEAERTWYEGSQLRYEKDGGAYGLPRDLVARVDATPTPAGISEAEVLARARDLLRSNDPDQSVRLLKELLQRSPRSLAGLQLLSEAEHRRGDPRAACDAAERAVKLDDRNPRSFVILGDALAALGDRLGAETAYRRSLSLHPDPDVQRRLGEVSSVGSASSTTGAQFRLRYDGGVNEPLGIAVVDALSLAFSEYNRRLGFHPDQPVTVILQLASEFQEGSAPGWAEGLNDGTIRVPVQGLNAPTPRLLQVLRHELAHSFITARTGGNCPTWLQEGLAQWLEGGVGPSERVRSPAREPRWVPLVRLEGPFQKLSAEEAVRAYGESLSAVQFIGKRKGERGLARLLNALGDGLPIEEALPVALGWSYAELQQAWEDSLRTTRSP